MQTRGIIAGVLAGLAAGGAGAAHADPVVEPADLRCPTVADCQVVLDRVYGEYRRLDASLVDARRDAVRQDRRIARLEQRVERLRQR